MKISPIPIADTPYSTDSEISALFEIRDGDAATYQVTLTDEDDDALDITGWTATLLFEWYTADMLVTDESVSLSNYTDVRGRDRTAVNCINSGNGVFAWSIPEDFAEGLTIPINSDAGVIVAVGFLRLTSASEVRTAFIPQYVIRRSAWTP